MFRRWSLLYVSCVVNATGKCRGRAGLRGSQAPGGRDSGDLTRDFPSIIIISASWEAPATRFGTRKSGTGEVFRRWSLLYVRFVVNATEKCRGRTGPVFEARRRPAGGKVAILREASRASSSFPHHERNVTILREASRASSSCSHHGKQGGRAPR